MLPQHLVELDKKVSEWNDRFRDENQNYDELSQDPEFVSIINHLMLLDEDSLMLLIGHSLTQNGELPSWFTSCD